MDPAVVGVVGTLLGVLLGAAGQQVQASRGRHWQQADLLRAVKRGVYAEYVRSVSASYAQALSGQRSRTEDASLLAATAEIEILSGREVWVPVRELTDTVIGVHTKIAAGGGVPESEVRTQTAAGSISLNYLRLILGSQRAQSSMALKLGDAGSKRGRENPIR